MGIRKRLKSLPSLDFLRGFECAARHLSFTKAGQELNITQSAVSRQVKALEDQLGIELFHRHIRALTLTEEGRALYNTFSAAMLDIESAIGKLSSSGEQRSISISTTVSFAALWLIPRLGAFRMRHPGIDVRVSATSEVQDIKRKRLHLAVRYARPNTQFRDARPLFDERVIAVCSPSLTATGAHKLKAPGDLEHQVLLHMDDTCGTWPWYTWDNLLDELGEARLKPAGALHFSQYDQLIQAAVDGHGIALGRRPLVDRLIHQGRLVELFPEHSIASGTYYLVTDSAPAEDSDVAALIDWLMEETRLNAEHDGRYTGRDTPSKPPSPPLRVA
ncbi:transcriptional regulator GcvA [Burkholderia alba]|uniref:transcriptional regulator GcvA n=1 Tax=Burkholderia alba TaxID=2683677 RepID=UPI002B0522A0|nr:transcriptional regulator GcvA [Burkholderia alba]